MKRTFSTAWTPAGATLAVLVLAACSDADPSSRSSQVVARVNDAEITVSQLNLALAAQGSSDPTPEEAQRALEGLINEQLLVEAALEHRLDRDPVVVQTLESARRQILARAYVERNVLPKEEITAAEQAAYYKAQPALFAQRRVYSLTAYTVPSAALTDEVVAELDGASTPDAVAAVFAARNVVPETQTLTRAAEQLPLEQLPQFAAAEVGDVIVHPPRDGKTTLMLITGIQPSPIGFESAQPIVQQYLANVRNAEALDAHLKAMRAAAAITRFDASLGLASAAEAAPPDADEAAESPVGSGAAVLH